MKPLILCFMILLIAAPAETNAPLTSLSFDNIKISAFLRTVYQETLGTDYVLEPEVVADERLVNVRVYDFRDKKKLAAFLTSMGYKVESRNGVDYIGKADKVDDLDFVVYAPKHKSVAQLRQALGGMFAGQFAGDERQIVFKGAKAETAKLKKILKTFDTKPAELVVRGKIYEVSKKTTDASSLSIITDVFKNAGLAVSSGSQLVNFLSFKDSHVNAYFSALDKDDRFKLISEPSLRIQANKTATLTVGADVPTLGSVTYQDGQPVQSVVYRSSGLIFELTPEIYENSVTLTVRQEMSNFGETANGVNGSPTLTKREIKTTITAIDGETVILGGLNETKNTGSKAGLSFLPDFFGAKSNTSDQTEIILSLEIKKVEN